MSTEAEKVYAREYYRRNRERKLAQMKAYREAHPEQERARFRRYYAEHREEIKERVRTNGAGPRYDASEKGRERDARYAASTKGMVRRVCAELNRAHRELENL